MENIDNMTRNSLEALSRDNLTESGKKKLQTEILSGVITLCLLGQVCCIHTCWEIPIRWCRSCYTSSVC